MIIVIHRNKGNIMLLLYIQIPMVFSTQCYKTAAACGRRHCSNEDLACGRLGRTEKRNKELIGRGVKFLVWRVLHPGDWLLLTFDAACFFGRSNFFFALGSTWVSAFLVGI